MYWLGLVFGTISRWLDGQLKRFWIGWQEGSHQASSLSDLDLTIRTVNVLGRSGITSLKQLLAMTETEVTGIRQLGETGQREILLALEARRLSLRSE
jgi:DNA-directed RNA polymerase alpha subunit